MLSQSRLRILLPTSQIVLGIALQVGNSLRPNTLGSPSWVEWDFQLCDGINAPVAPIMQCVRSVTLQWAPRSHSLQLASDWFVHAMLVGLLWYAVAVELGGEGRSVLASKTKAWFAVDILAVSAGALLWWIALLVRRQFGAVTMYSNLVALPYFLWSGALGAFYAHDLWRRVIIRFT